MKPATVAPLLEQSHGQMLAKIKEIGDRSQDDNWFLEDRSLRDAERKFTAIQETGSAEEIGKLQFDIATSAFRVGQEDKAIEQFSELLNKVQGGQSIPSTSRVQLVFQLGEAYLRRAETLNCCLRYNPQSCLFPIQGGGIHDLPESSQKAIEYFTQTLRESTPNSYTHLSARWLLNIAYMTVGKYPDGVPSEYLIPPSSFKSDSEFPRFPNISAELGLSQLNLSGGVVADDFNQDGFIDLLLSEWHPRGPLKLKLNGGDGTFTDVSTEAGLDGITGGLNMVHADYDNDGDVDVLVLRGAWLGEKGKLPNSLLQNQGDGYFIDVSYAAGIAGVDFPTQTASWGDFDLDGYLDLYIGNENSVKVSAPSQLFHNNRDGTFTDVAAIAGVTNDRFAKGVVWGDFDADGYPDIYVSNLRERNRLYHNNQNGTFTDVAVSAGVELPISSFPTWFWDYDNDGDLDIYVAAYSADIGDVAASYLGLRCDAETERLYRNDGTGHFMDVARISNLRRPSAPMGANFGDLDNDGFLDFYLGTGYPSYRSLMPNLMFWNRQGQTFSDVTFAGGFGSLQKGHAIAFADFDHDGDQDVFEEMGGAFAGDKFVNSFFLNPGFGNQWVNLQLVGVKANRCAIGARIEVKLRPSGKSNSEMTSVYKYVNSGGSFGANPLRQQIGIPAGATIESVKVTWPSASPPQTIVGIETNQSYRITEGAPEPDLVNLNEIRFQ